MLVLSRKTDQKIVFPNLDVELQVLQVKGKTVKLGIKAPKDVLILRPEACDESELEAARSDSRCGVDCHRLRNHLNAINLGVRLFQRQSEAGLDDEADETIQRVINGLGRMDREIGEAKEKVRQVTQSRQMRLLVVEDDENERELLAGLLRLHDFEVATAANGEDAMVHLGTHEMPDFVLLDMKMPNVDGPATIRRLRSDSRYAKLKVFAVSGTSPMEMGLEENAYSGWFPKPLDPERLIQAITRDMQTLATA